MITLLGIKNKMSEGPDQKVELIALTKPLKVDFTTEEFVAYCARVSNPENQRNKKTSGKLIKYLLDKKHWSPFEMVSIVMQITTTRDISRQIIRHRSFSFSEWSQRYAKASGMEGTRQCRLQNPKDRQGSIYCTNDHITKVFDRSQKLAWFVCSHLYNLALRMGVAKEQARVLLPEGLTITTLFMAGTLRSWIHYCQLRTGNGTQWEHQEIAQACAELIGKEFPTIKAYLYP
jgi:thymidylate synthase (FAD)